MKPRFTMLLSVVVCLLIALWMAPSFAQKGSASKKNLSAHKAKSSKEVHPQFNPPKKEKAAAEKKEAATSASSPNRTKGNLTPIWRKAEKVHVSKPLREMVSKPRKAPAVAGDKFGPGKPEVREVPNPVLREGGLTRPHEDPAIVDVSKQRGPQVPQIPAPFLDFESISNIDNANEYGFRVLPSDSNGEVGPNHYVVQVNNMIEVYDKTGASLVGPVRNSDFWNGLGGVCDTTNSGDPVVLYDQLADRWFISQFGLIGPPFHQCIAISQNGDPTGAFYQFDFVMQNDAINDYPHFGVWPDAYYMMDHQFDPGFVGSGAFAFDREKMLAGDPSASYIYFNLNDFDPSIGGHLPADADGLVPPAPGSPGIFMMFRADEFGDAFDGVSIYEFHADFATPGNSTFTENAQSPIHVASFNPLSPPGRQDIPQPPPATAAHNLDSIQDRFMHKLQYRNFEDYETFAVTHTVDIDPTAGYRAGVRVYEIRREAGSYFVEKQLSLSGADSLNRWMGSAAIDGSGNLAVGYSVSNSSTFPSIRYSGISSEGLFLGENEIIAGAGSQTSTSSRWGDYSAISVDPINDCEFWYINQYYVTSNEVCPTNPSTACWHNRVGAFTTDPGFCTPPDLGTLDGTVTDAATTNPILGARVVATNTTSGATFEVATDGAGDYSRVLPPGDYTLVAKATYFQDSAPVNVTITASSTTTQNFQLNGIPALDFLTATVDDSATGNNNGVLDFNECGLVNVTLRNVGFADATNVAGTLSSLSGGVTVPVAGATQTYGTIAGQTNATAGFNVSTSPALVCNTPINLQLDVTSDQASYTFPVSLTSGNMSFESIEVPTEVIDIPTAFAAESAVTVSGVPAPGSVDRILVNLHITHTYDSDLDIRLLGPDGTTVIDLSTGNGGSGDNFGTDCGARTVFDDTAATPITAGVAPFVGSFSPEEPLSTFLSLSDLNGTWTLLVNDTFTGDEGLIVCWSISFVPAGGCTDGGGVCAGSVPVLTNPVPTVSGGNGDSDVDTNECFDLHVAVTNDGTASATGVMGTLTTTTPGVTIITGTAAYPDIAPGATESNITPFQVQTSQGFDCTAGDIDFNLHLTKVEGTADLPFSLTPGIGIGAPTTFNSTDTPISIPDDDDTGISSTIPVSGITGPVGDVNVAVHITHTFNGDLSLVLEGPQGQQVVLSQNNGDDSDNFGTDCPADDNDDVVFDDSGATSIVGVDPGNGVPIVGTFSPEEPLSGFNLTDGNGNWTLHVADNFAVDIGNLECWSLTISPAACEDAGCAVCDYSNDFNAAGLTWIEVKPTVTQPGDGFLHVNPANKKAITTSDPSFAGLDLGTFEFDVQFSGGPDAKSWLYTHRTASNNQMEVQFNEEQDKVIVKQRTPSGIVKKENANFTIDPATNYNVVINYDGTTYTVTINTTPAITFTPVGTLPVGIIGGASKDNEMLIDNVCVNDATL